MGDEVVVHTPCFIGEANPCHDRLAMVSRCNASRDMPTGRLSDLAAELLLVCGPSSLLAAPSMGRSIYSVVVIADAILKTGC